MTRQTLREPLAQGGVVLLATLLVTGAIAGWWPTSTGAMQDTARVCSAIACLWCCGAAGLGRRSDRSASPTRPDRQAAHFLRVAALLLGVGVAVIQSVIVLMRTTYVAMDLMNGYPFAGPRGYGFSAEGIWSLVFLTGACVVSLVSTNDRRLAACGLWSAFLLLWWACLLPPVLKAAPSGGYEPTGSTLLPLAAASGLLALVAGISGNVRNQRGVRARGLPELGSGFKAESGSRRRLDARAAVPGQPAEDTVEQPARDTRSRVNKPLLRDSPSYTLPPGLPTSVAAIALVVILLSGFHLAVPVRLARLGPYSSALVVTGSDALASLACFLLTRHDWSAHLADAGMALTSLVFCALATLAVPSDPASLAERYPILFNAMMIGLAIAAALGTWMASARPQERDPMGSASKPTTREEHQALLRRLAPRARRFAFLNAALALALGYAMALWPQWPTVPVMDDSLGRVTAGLTGNLLLFLVMLWSARRFRAPAWHALSVLTVLSTAAFMIVRMLPYSPYYG